MALYDGAAFEVLLQRRGGLLATNTKVRCLTILEDGEHLFHLSEHTFHALPQTVEHLTPVASS